MIRFGIIGAGWRSEFYVRIANCMPDLFCVTGMYIRNKEKQTYFSNASAAGGVRIPFSIISLTSSRENHPYRVCTLYLGPLPIQSRSFFILYSQKIGAKNPVARQGYCLSFKLWHLSLWEVAVRSSSLSLTHSLW